MRTLLRLGLYLVTVAVVSVAAHLYGWAGGVLVFAAFALGVLRMAVETFGGRDDA